MFEHLAPSDGSARGGLGGVASVEEGVSLRVDSEVSKAQCCFPVPSGLWLLSQDVSSQLTAAMPCLSVPLPSFLPG